MRKATPGTSKLFVRWRATNRRRVGVSGLYGEEVRMASESQVIETATDDVLRWSAEIVASYVAQNNLPAAGVADLIRSVHEALSNVGQEPEAAPERRKPAVPISRSVQHEFIVCLEDGKKL